MINLDNIKKPSMLILLGGNLLAIIGCLLPFVSVSFLGVDMNVSYMEGDGKIVFALCVVSMVLAFVKLKFAFVPNIIALLVTFVGIANTAELSLEFLGIGAYIIVIANVVAILGCFKAKKEEI